MNPKVKISILDLIGRIGLNEKQIKEYNANRELLESKMKEARVEIKSFEIKRSAFVLGFFVSTILMVNVLPLIVYTFPVHLVMSLYYTYKILRWELEFIKNFKLNCNPDWRVRTVTAVSKISGKVIPVISFFSIGTIIGCDTLYEKYYGESFITKLGKQRGVYKTPTESDIE